MLGWCWGKLWDNLIIQCLVHLQSTQYSAPLRITELNAMHVTSRNTTQRIFLINNPEDWVGTKYTFRHTPTEGTISQTITVGWIIKLCQTDLDSLEWDTSTDDEISITNNLPCVECASIWPALHVQTLLLASEVHNPFTRSPSATDHLPIHQHRILTSISSLFNRNKWSSLSAAMTDTNTLWYQKKVLSLVSPDSEGMWCISYHLCMNGKHFDWRDSSCQLYLLDARRVIRATWYGMKTRAHMMVTMQTIFPALVLVVTSPYPTVEICQTMQILAWVKEQAWSENNVKHWDRMYSTLWDY
jgi:hypothetical protein